MDLTLALHSNADRDIESATLRNEPEKVRKLNFGLDKGTMLLESWVLRSGGTVVQSGGADTQVQVPADHLDELLDQLRMYQEATESSVACGVGTEPAEALTALRVARHRGGNPAVVLYTPEVAQEADQDQDGELDPILPEEVDALEGDRQPDAPVPAGTMQKAQFGNQPSPGEATKIQQGALSPDAAQPSAPSPQQPPPAPASPAGAPAQGGGQPQGNQLLQAVGQVLMDVKKQLPALEQMKQQNPAAYDSIVAMTQAVIALAQKLTGGGQPAPGGAPVQKSEGETRVVGHIGSCPLCGEKKGRHLEAHLAESHEHEWNERKKNPNDPLVQQMKKGELFRSACAAYGKKIGKAEWKPESEGLDQEQFSNGFFHEQRQAQGALDDHATAMKVLVNLLRNPRHYQSAPVDPPTMSLHQPVHKDEPVPHAPQPLKPAAHHHLNLPAGSQRDQRVKVVHSDGSTSWVQVKAGQITSEDGHPISSRNPGGR